MDKNIKNQNKYIKCECSSHALEIECDEELKQFNLSIWQYGSNISSNLSWKERFRWAIKILTTGSVWADQIILSEKKAGELVEYINDRKTRDKKELLHG